MTTHSFFKRAIVVLSLLLDGVALLLGIESRSKTISVITQPEQAPALSYENELQAIKQAIQTGDLNMPSVRNVRTLLGCSQNKAVEIARMCRVAEEQMSLI